MLARIVIIVGGLLELAIGLRILFRLIGANPDNGFVQFVYDVSTPLVAPFAGILNQDATVVSGAGAVTQSVFDWTALIAFVVYGLIIGVVNRVATVR